MFVIRSFLAVALCWAELAAAGSDILMTARQSQALGIETVALAAPSSAAGNGIPAQVVIPNQQIRVVSAPLAGMVESLALAVNQPVRKGQLLARLQSPALAELQRDFLQTALQSQLAQNTLSRDEKLHQDGIVAESRYLAAKSNSATLAAAASEKRQALRLAGMNDGAIGKLLAGQAIGSALEVVSPLEGVVLEQMAVPGQRVEAATPLFKVARLSPLWLEIQVPLAQAKALQTGAAVRVLPPLSANSLPGGAPAGGVPAGIGGTAAQSGEKRDVGSLRDTRITGRVISVGRSVSEASQTIMVRAEVSDGADNLRPGQYVEAVVGAAAGAKQWAVPNAALVRAGNQAYVFVQTAAGYRPQPVQVLSQSAAMITVTGDLRGEEKVVAKGTVALKAAWQGLGGGE